MSNFQPGDETFDDVTGHKLPNRGALPEDEATEGHRLFAQGPSDDDKVEGHRLFAQGPSDDEVEGHKLGRTNPTDDEAEGHRRPQVK